MQTLISSFTANSNGGIGSDKGPMFTPQPFLEGQPFPLRYAIQRQLWADQIAAGPVTRRMKTETLAAVVMGKRPLRVISNGAGVDSEFMTIWGIEGEGNLKPDLVEFADTGDELPETYAMVAWLKKYCEDRGVPFVLVANKYGKTLTQYFHDKGVIPSRQKRDCTSKFKIAPMRNYLRETFGNDASFIKFVGYNADEKKRVDKASKSKNPSYEKVQYPVYAAGVTRAQELEYLRKKNVPVAEKSGCFDCIFTVKAGWAMLKAKHPELYAEAKRFDEESNEHAKSKAGYYKDKSTGRPRGFYLSGGRSLADLEAEFEANPLKTMTSRDSGKQVFVKCDGTILTTEARLGSK